MAPGHQTIALLIVTSQFLSIDSQANRRHGMTEHCQWETFNATCRSNEVILMISASYGRMHIGRCVPFDYFLGCSTDVLEQLESRCSGRESCLVSIPDAELFKVHPCRKDLVAYLEASYRCVPVSGIPAKGHSPSSDMCTSDIPLTQSSGYLAGSVTHRTGLGSRRCPWVVQVPAGQRINVTLYDFSSKDPAVARQPFDDTVPAAAFAAAAAATANLDGGDCPPLVIFRETTVGAPQRDRQVRLCPDGSLERRKVVYSSRSNRLNIIIPTENTNQQFANMMLYFESVGCPDPEISVNAMLTRKEETLAIFCNQTGERWHLVCKENQWIGTYNNCSKSVLAPIFEDNAMKLNRGFPIGLLIAIAVGVIAGVVLGFLLLVMIFTCKKRFFRRRAEQSILLIDYENQQNAYKLMDLKTPLPLQQGCECVLAEFRSASESFDPSDPMIVHSSPPQEVYFSEELLRNTLNKCPAVNSSSAATSAGSRQTADCTCNDIYRHTGTLCCDAWSPGGYLPEDYNVVGNCSPLKTSTTARLL